MSSEDQDELQRRRIKEMINEGIDAWFAEHGGLNEAEVRRAIPYLFILLSWLRVVHGWALLFVVIAIGVIALFGTAVSWVMNKMGWATPG